ncbi:hypothetical protein ASE00_16345 [Sphingomonas sp. Root710]|nr:hypothetical protein ASE00_16345 [Sphingomonas sp. Root710]
MANGSIDGLSLYEQGQAWTDIALATALTECGVDTDASTVGQWRRRGTLPHGRRLRALLDLLFGDDPAKRAWRDDLEEAARNAVFTASDMVHLFKVMGRPTSLITLHGDGWRPFSPNFTRVKIKGTIDRSDWPQAILNRQAELAAYFETEEAILDSKWDGYQVGVQSLAHPHCNDEIDYGLSVNGYENRYSDFQATVGDLCNAHEQGRLATARRTLGLPRHASEPVPGLANGLGTVIVVRTADDFIITVRRSNKSLREGAIDAAIAEGIDRKKDKFAHEPDSINVWHTAWRGINEELKVEATYDDIKLLGFAVDTNNHQFNYVGVVRTTQKYDDILAARAGHDKCKWEVVPQKMRWSTLGIRRMLEQCTSWPFSAYALSLACIHWGLFDAMEYFGHSATDIEAMKRRAAKAKDSEGPDTEAA